VRMALLLALGLVAPAVLSAQDAKDANAILGSWEALDPPSTARPASGKSEGPRIVIVRPDSSASYGRETVRWRLKKKDVLALAIGGEWTDYKFSVKGDRLVLSEGDLEKPVTFKRVGPPTPRPENVKVPPDPDTEG